MSLATNVDVMTVIKNELRFNWPNNIPDGPIPSKIFFDLTSQPRYKQDEDIYIQLVHWRLGENANNIKKLTITTRWHLV